MWKTRILAVLILALGFGVGYFVYKSEMAQKSPEAKSSWLGKLPFQLGLDLSGGTHLVYRADLTSVTPSESRDAMESLRDVIERRVNLFGVSEPVVQLEHGGFANQGEERLIVDLPGVTDVSKAISMIGQTPLLEFKTEKKGIDKNINVGPDGAISAEAFLNSFESTPLTGRYLDKAILEFDPNTAQPVVSLQFDEEGAKLFEEITRANVGKTVAIFLDGAPISVPYVNEAIAGGRAQISGNFTPKEAKELVGRLNSGALPVPIELISTQTIGASLGEDAVSAGIRAGIIGFLAVALFLVLWYRLPGIIAVVSLSIYSAITLALFKLIPVTLTSAGIAGFIISVGLAVDANVLIFERIKEEIKKGMSLPDSVRAGFEHAWLAIRDSNTSSIITALILFWFGTSLIKGFALVFGLGVVVSMFSAITVTRIFLYALNIKKSTKFSRFLLSSGFSNGEVVKNNG